MAWRDSRTSRSKLLFFSCSIVLGIAALTAIGSLASNLERAVEEQAKTLLGADLVKPDCQQGMIPIPVAPGNEMAVQNLLNAALMSTDQYFPDGPCVTNIDTAIAGGGQQLRQRVVAQLLGVEF